MSEESRFVLPCRAFPKRLVLGLGLIVALTAGCRTDSGIGSAESLKPSRTGLVLAETGQARLPIIISPEASAETKEVATELAEYLYRITGAKFEVRIGAGSRGIVVGTLAEFPNPALKKSLASRNEWDGREAYAIRTEPGRLLLIGVTDLAVSHVMFRFLEVLGCRWFFPAKEWEIVPHRPNLTFRWQETDRPVMLSRVIAFGCGTLWGDPEDTRQATLDWENWCRRNRMAASLVVETGHSWGRIIAKNQAQFDLHPEYYSPASNEKLELSNPAVRKMAVDYALDLFRRSRASGKDARDMVSLEPSDGGGFSESEASRKLGTISDQVFGLANEAARAVQKEFPGKMVGMLAYGWHTDPPSFDLEPNVFVMRTAGFNYTQHGDAELWDLWAKRCRNIGVYEYFSVIHWDGDRLPGGTAADISYLRTKIPFCAERNVIGITAESGNNWGPHGRGYYLANKLMWNPRADLSALSADFYEKAFGPAAPAMRAYYERLDAGNNRNLLSKDLLARAYRDVQDATRLAVGHPEILARLNQIKNYLHYNYLHWKLSRAATTESRKALSLALLTHCYRTRFEYMNHWAGIRYYWTESMAKEFNEPSWHRDSPDNPWKVATPVPPAETEKNFEEGLAWFQPQTVAPKTFSTDLVPVRFDVSASVVSGQSYHHGPRYALYSFAGEPLSVDLLAGVIEIYRTKGDARYSVKNARGKVVSEGRLPLDNKSRSLEFKVPGPGLYYFDMNDSGAGWSIAIPAGRPATVVLAAADGFFANPAFGSSLGPMQDMCFYVPKGTKQIDYYWDGHPHQVLNPERKVVLKVDTFQEFISVPVPEGQDGKLWYFSGLWPTRFGFFNVPNHIAASPESLLVPREVAVSDGLPIRTRLAND